jgi:hypothetical protein
VGYVDYLCIRSFRKLRAFAIGVCLLLLLPIMWTAFPSSDYYALSVTFQGLWSFVQGLPSSTSHPPLHSLESFPCSQCKTQAECLRWRVLLLPRPRFAASQHRYKVNRLTCIPFCTASTVLCTGPYSHFALMVSGCLADMSSKVCQGRAFP